MWWSFENNTKTLDKEKVYQNIGMLSSFKILHLYLIIPSLGSQKENTLSLLFKQVWEMFQSLENLLRNICHIALIYASLSYDIFCKLQTFKERTAQFLSNKKKTQSVLVLYTMLEFTFKYSHIKEIKLDFWWLSLT